MKGKLKKIQYNSPVILTFTFISLIALGLGAITKGGSTRILFTNYRTSFISPIQYIRLFTHIFGHANWEHFVGNFIIILIIGPMIEEKYGSKELIKMMAITAFITGLLNTVFFGTGLLGASGIVFMLILLGSFVNVQTGRIPLTFVIVVIIFLGQEIINGIIINDNISQLTHIVGGICGGLFGYWRYNK